MEDNEPHAILVFSLPEHWPACHMIGNSKIHGVWECARELKAKEKVPWWETEQEKLGIDFSFRWLIKSCRTSPHESISVLSCYLVKDCWFWTFWVPFYEIVNG